MIDIRYQPVPYVRISHPEWSRNATIYQINTNFTDPRTRWTSIRGGTAS